LECEPGYVSDSPIVTTCVNGKYKPYKPSDLVCQPAIALILTTQGEMELFSDTKCNKKLTNLPPFITSSQTIDLLDSQLAIVGFNVQTQTWNYISLEDPREGLLANQWTNQTLSTITHQSKIPRHANLIDGEHLVLKGGDENTKPYPNIGQLKSINFFDQQGIQFTSFPSDSCRVRINKDTYLVTGGFADKEIQSSMKVFEVTMSKQTVLERPSLAHARAFHSCAVVSKGLILVSGGVANHSSNLPIPDELYNVTSGSSELINQPMANPRFSHQLIRLGHTVFALGGRAENGSELSTVEMFDADTSSWTLHPKRLLSNATAGIAVTAFPQTAVDCLVECNCGRPSSERGMRIINGTEVKVEH
jgi:hypothetical protein